MPLYRRNDLRPASGPMVRCLIDLVSRELLSGESAGVPGIAGYRASIEGLDAGASQEFSLDFVGPVGLIPGVAGGPWDIGKAIAWISRALESSPIRSDVFTALGRDSFTFPDLTMLRAERVSDSFSMTWPSGVDVSQLAAPAHAEWAAMVLGARLPQSQVQLSAARL